MTFDPFCPSDFLSRESLYDSLLSPPWFIEQATPNLNFAPSLAKTAYARSMIKLCSGLVIGKIGETDNFSKGIPLLGRD